MSFAALQQAVFGKRSVWLYRLEHLGQVANLTSGSRPVVASLGLGGSPDETEFLPEVITHTRILRTSAIGREETQLVFPESSQLARSYLGENGYQANLVRIWRGYAEDTDGEFELVFRGRVIAAQPRWTRITLQAQNRFTELAGKGISAVMQRPCRHAHYFGGCGLVLSEWQVAGGVTAVSGSGVTVPEAAAAAAGSYSGGILEWNGAKQLITRHVGSALSLLAPIPGLAAALVASPPSVPVLIAPGCNLTRERCVQFGNIANFGGFPFMEGNPYDGRSMF